MPKGRKIEMRVCRRLLRRPIKGLNLIALNKKGFASSSSIGFVVFFLKKGIVFDFVAFDLGLFFKKENS